METFLGLSGAGDLFLTSSSTMSRNYRVGLGLASKSLLVRYCVSLVKWLRALLQLGQLQRLGKEKIFTRLLQKRLV